ncbi:MAG: tRNA (adenosine(37)-N6)-threonylcarbamoyltransferase complex ATPase subunit type 1 TsaE [Proteobacteria bacterium]|nr:tRNA (adenosine(37)-N6)-threonylcarbamoyltransferase complex ATPase subunit type 1 TsaE [Pseudomonadota bacterium]
MPHRKCRRFSTGRNFYKPWIRSLPTALRQRCASALRWQQRLGLGGVPQDVTSPTFTLVHEYHACRLPVFHFDFYRLEAESELRNIGWDDYLREDGVLLIEWAERFPDAFPKGTRFIQFEISSETERLLRFS